MNNRKNSHSTSSSPEDDIKCAGDIPTIVWSNGYHSKSDEKDKESLLKDNVPSVDDNNCVSQNANIIQFDSFDENHFNTKLYHTKRRVLELKDYHEEARAMRDIQKFLDHPIVLFKVHSTVWVDIAREMLQKLSKEKPDMKLDIESALNSVISHDGIYVIPECIQSIIETSHGLKSDQSFVVAIGNTTSIIENQVVLCRLDHPFNFGEGAEGVRIICLVLCPVRTKNTKSAVQVARTYATLLSNINLRQNLLNAHSSEDFAHEFKVENSRIRKEHDLWKRSSEREKSEDTTRNNKGKWYPGKEIFSDVKRRARFYLSDFTKDVKDCNSIQKITSTTLFLYFSILLPAIAFGVLYSELTDGKLDVKNVIVSQALSGIFWVIFSGQHLVVIRTTIPLIIYTKVIYTISKNWENDGSFFYTFYAMVGFSNAFFLIIYGLTGASKVMKYCTRSTEEILSFFIALAFMVDTVKYVLKEFHLYYCFPVPGTILDDTDASVSYDHGQCNPTKPILAVFLVLVTVLVGVRIFSFKQSPYLTTAKRTFVAEYAIVIAVAVGTFIGSYLFADIALTKFTVNEKSEALKMIRFKEPSVLAVVIAIGLGFIMSILFFLENNIAASMVNNPSNKLKKGVSYHYDIVVLGLINAIMSLLGLPYVHGSLPHSPLHVRALADVEECIEDGFVSENIIRVRETRLTNLFAHLMISASVLLVPYPLNIIPIPVLYGLFTYLAITALKDLQLWERMILIFTEQSLYPPLHYVRKVPQKIIHCFTVMQLLQLFVLCAVSFAGSAYLKMVFPFIIFLLIPLRVKVLPKLIPKRHLDALDGY